MTLYINGTSGISGVDGSAGTPAIQGTDANTGISFPAADTVAINTGGVERSRVDSSGRLLVGTSSSRNVEVESRLQVEGDSVANASVSITRTNANPGYVQFGSGSSGNNVTSGSGLGIFTFAGYHTSAYYTGARIAAEVDGTPGANDMPGRLVFSTTPDSAASPVERLRIKSNGHLQVTTDGGFGGLDGVSHGFRTTTANWVAQFMNDQITGTNNYGVQIKYVSSAPNGTGNLFLLCGDSAADRVQLRSNGGLANYQANDVNLSDRNAKKDITPAAGTWDCIKEWEIVNYRYKDQPDDADLNLGVIAQQVAESCPEVITVFQEAKEATEDQPAQEERLGVKEQQMYWMAIKALQEAQVRIETLEAEVAALKAQ